MSEPVGGGNKRNVGIGEMIISADSNDVLVAPNLGSCLGVAIYDPKLRIGGMIHCLLPFSKSDPEKAKSKPTLYVDTGVSFMLEELIRHGLNKRTALIKVAGGSAINDVNNVFGIGERNFTVLRKLLWKNNLLLTASDVGGDSCRTVSLYISTGEVWVRKGSVTTELK